MKTLDQILNENSQAALDAQLAQQINSRRRREEIRSRTTHSISPTRAAHWRRMLDRAEIAIMPYVTACGSRPPTGALLLFPDGTHDWRPLPPTQRWTFPLRRPFSGIDMSHDFAIQPGEWSAVELEHHEFVFLGVRYDVYFEEVP